MSNIPTALMTVRVGSGSLSSGSGEPVEKQKSCEECAFRAKYENNPKSFLGRLWRWHAGWCPGFKKYITSLPVDERIELAERYRMEKYAHRS